jgi:hypothetical protein
MRISSTTGTQDGERSDFEMGSKEASLLYTPESLGGFQSLSLGRDSLSRRVAPACMTPWLLAWYILDPSFPWTGVLPADRRFSLRRWPSFVSDPLRIR